MNEYTYKIINRKTGKNPWPNKGTGTLKQVSKFVEKELRYSKSKLHKMDYEILQFEIVPRISIPITSNVDFTLAMCHTFKDEKFEPI